MATNGKAKSIYQKQGERCMACLSSRRRCMYPSVNEAGQFLALKIL